MVPPSIHYILHKLKKYFVAPDDSPIPLLTVLVVGGGGVATRGLGMLLTLGAHLGLTWFSAPADLGAFFILVGVTNIVANLGSLGMGAAAVRFVPQYIADGSRSLQAGYAVNTLQITSWASLTISGAAILVATVGSEHLTTHLQAGLVLFAILLPVTTLQLVSLDLLRAFGLPLQGQTVSSFLPPIILSIGAISFAQFGPLSFNLMGALACFATGLTTVVQLYSVRRLILLRLIGTKRQTETIEWLRVSLPIMASTLVFVSAFSVDWLVVATLMSAAKSAIYRVDLYVLSVQGMFFATFYGVVGNYISRNFHQQQKTQYEAFLRRVNAVQMLPTLLVSLVLIIWAHEILGIFGPEFIAGADSLRILVAVWLFRSSLGPQEILLNIGGSERFVTIVNLSTVVLSGIFSVLLTPVYGLEGAAAAHAISWGSTGVVLHLGVVRRLGLRVAFHQSVLSWVVERMRK